MRLILAVFFLVAGDFAFASSSRETYFANLDCSVVSVGLNSPSQLLGFTVRDEDTGKTRIVSIRRAQARGCQFVMHPNVSSIDPYVEGSILLNYSGSTYGVGYVLGDSASQACSKDSDVLVPFHLVRETSILKNLADIFHSCIAD